MSGSERQRRYLDRLLASGGSKSIDAHVQKQLSATQSELSKARARIAELEKALAQRASTQHANTVQHQPHPPAQAISSREAHLAIRGQDPRA
jgi:hypothetical protein